MKNFNREKNDYIKENQESSIRKMVDNFLCSDSISATTAKFLLAFISMGGIIIVGATVPGLVKAIGTFKSIQYRKKRHAQKKIENSFSYLKKKQLIKVVKERDGRVQVELTNKGKIRLAEYSLSSLDIKKPKKWDGKWRVLMFDIPAHSKTYDYARDALRNKIKSLGFYQVQKSVWVYPYECEDELLFIAEMFKVQDYIEIMTVEKMLHEKDIREKFQLL
jgi:hypothetical protein